MRRGGVTLEELVREYANQGIDERLYAEIVNTVRAVVYGRRYPPSYSPTGRWDDHALTALAHDWTMTKLLRYGHLEHFLASNEDLRGFRKGLELSFRDFLIGQKRRTVLDNLFQRANMILVSEDRFRLFNDTGKKATRLWGLSNWQNVQPFQGSDGQLIEIGFRLPALPVIRYRPDARKLSPILSDRDLAEFIASLLGAAQELLSLERMMVVFKYRFALLEVTEMSLDEPLSIDQEGHALSLQQILGTDEAIEEQFSVAETAEAVLRDLTPRQRRVLWEYVQPDATLTRVAELVGCSKSTVDNELRRAMQTIREYTGGYDEARNVYERLIEALNPVP
jgi:RNA polymerase sigma factor (sigma-70 family)